MKDVSFGYPGVKKILNGATVKITQTRERRSSD